MRYRVQIFFYFRLDTSLTWLGCLQQGSETRNRSEHSHANPTYSLTILQTLFINSSYNKKNLVGETE